MNTTIREGRDPISDRRYWFVSSISTVSTKIHHGKGKLSWWSAVMQDNSHCTKNIYTEANIPRVKLSDVVYSCRVSLLGTLDYTRMCIEHFRHGSAGYGALCPRTPISLARVFTNKNASFILLRRSYI